MKLSCKFWPRWTKQYVLRPRSNKTQHSSALAQGRPFVCKERMSYKHHGCNYQFPFCALFAKRQALEQWNMCKKHIVTVYVRIEDKNMLPKTFISPSGHWFHFAHIGGNQQIGINLGPLGLLQLLGTVGGLHKAPASVMCPILLTKLIKCRFGKQKSTW